MISDSKKGSEMSTAFSVPNLRVHNKMQLWFPICRIEISVLFILASSKKYPMSIRGFCFFGLKCPFWNNNKKGMFVPNCVYHFNVSSHFMLLKC